LHFDSRGLLFVALFLAGCGQEETALAPPTAVTTVSTCGGSGYLAGQLRGALTAEVEWHDQDILCESMVRPDDRGVRLRFSGAVGDERLAIIIAMPALEPGITGTDIDVVVTVTVDGSGRFFSTPALGSCWADVTRNTPLDVLSAVHIVAGRLACVGPLGEFNGDAFVEISDLRFSGIAKWEE
jgi:hypothetical protein